MACMRNRQQSLSLAAQQRRPLHIWITPDRVRTTSLQGAIPGHRFAALHYPAAQLLILFGFCGGFMNQIPDPFCENVRWFA